MIHHPYKSQSHFYSDGATRPVPSIKNVTHENAYLQAHTNESMISYIYIRTNENVNINLFPQVFFTVLYIAIRHRKTPNVPR